MRMHPHPAVSASLLFAACQLFSGQLWAASTIVRDGSLGTGPTTALTSSGTITRSAVTYNKIAIPEAYGQRAGANVFHSFSTFNVGTGDGAVFSINAPAANVISRVTGGTASAINGLISLDPGVTGSAPNFFFINPAGVTFGAGAAIDVPAAFHVSTADYIKFPDGNFYANPATASTFSAMDPVAFGFLAGAPGNLALSGGASLRTLTGAIDLAGGNVGIDNADITTQGGDIRIVALGTSSSAREISLTGTVADARGSFQVTNGAAVLANTVGNVGGGNIAISAGDVVLNNGTVWTQSNSGATAQIGSVDVMASGNISMSNGGQIGSATISASNAGHVAVNAATMTIDGYPTGIFDEAQGGTGNAGTLSVTTTGDLTLRNVGGIDADTYAAGRGGQVSVHVGGNLSILTGGYIDAISTATGDAGGVAISANSILVNRNGNANQTGVFTYANGSAGNAGNVDISTPGSFALLNGGSVASFTNTTGAGGQVTVHADSLTLDSPTTTARSSIRSFSYTNASGVGGDISITAAGAVTLLKGAYIDAGSYGAGNGATINVNAASILANRTTSASSTGFFSYANGSTGNAGAINLTTAGNIALLNGAAVNASTYVAGTGGQIMLNAGSVTLDSPTTSNRSYIGAFSYDSGHAGNIGISTTGSLSILKGAYLDASAYWSGDGGNIDVTAGSIVLSRNGAARQSGIFSYADGTTGNAGTIRLTTAGGLSIYDSAISTTTYAAGNGGHIAVNAGSILIDGQGTLKTNGIYSDTYSSGNAGRVDITTRGDLTLVNGGFMDSSTYVGAGNAGDLTIRSGGNLTLLNSQIGSNTLTSGAGGAVDISAANITLQDLAAIFVGTYGGQNTGYVGVVTGNAGNLTVTTPGTLTMINGGYLDAGTSSAGHGGHITVNAGTIFADGLGRQTNSWFTGITNSATATGNAGSIFVTTTGDISLLNYAQIGSGAWAAGNTGLVSVSARNILIDGFHSTIVSGTRPSTTGNGGGVVVKTSGDITVSNGAYIGSDSQGAGAAGTVNIVSDGKLSLLSGGYVSSGTTGAGVAGTVSVSANSILVDGGSPRTGASMITASASAGSSGQTGDVSVTARDSITLSNGGQFSIENDATVGSPASITRSSLSVSAPTIVMKDAQITAASTGNIAASNIAIHFTDLFNIDPSAITTSANTGNGGAISIAGAGTMILDRSQITTSVAGLTGNGGDISIQANTLVMNSGFIQANTAAASAVGGSITIDVNAIIPSGNMLFLGGTTPYSFQPDVFGFNVIQAAAPTGLSGAVQVTSPILDISGTLTVLNAKTIGTAGLARSPCQSTGGSSLVQTGRGGFTPLARDLLGPGGSATGPLAGNSATPGTGALLLSAAMRPSTLVGKCTG